MKSGNLNLLEPSGPLQACNGTALPVYINCIWAICRYTRKKLETRMDIHKVLYWGLLLKFVSVFQI